jgi:hypothetical protein
VGFEYVFHRDAHSPDAGLAAAPIRGNRDSIMKVHEGTTTGFLVLGEYSFAFEVASRRMSGWGKNARNMEMAPVFCRLGVIGFREENINSKELPI